MMINKDWFEIIIKHKVIKNKDSDDMLLNIKKIKQSF
jgi:hypothetical protein